MTGTGSNESSEELNFQQVKENPDKNKIRKKTVSSVTETLEKSNLTIDQKINQLTVQVQNLTLGVSGLMEIMRIVLGKQIENLNAIEGVVAKTKDIETKTANTWSTITEIKEIITNNQVNILNEHKNTMEKLERIVRNQKVLAEGIEKGSEYKISV